MTAHSDTVAAAEPGLVLVGQNLDPTERLFDAPDALADGIAAMPRRAPADRGTAAADVCPMRGVTRIERSSLTKSSALSALSAPSVIACGRSARGSILCSAATRTACRSANVRQASAKGHGGSPSAHAP